jgi:secretion/DNA translocation related TadE-like protein
VTGHVVRSEHGSATVHAAAVAVFLVVAAIVLLQVGSLVRMRHQVAAAADLAALAGSQASVRGEDGCAAARTIARRNGAELSACRMDFDVATVNARAVSPPWWGSRWVTNQDARAAPDFYLD